MCGTDLVGAVCVAASKLISHAQSSSTETFSNIVLNSLCPALNSLLNDGLKPLLETAFGDVLNSVWQLVETSTQQGQSYVTLFVISAISPKVIVNILTYKRAS